MSHREEVPAVKPTSNSSQPKSTANSKHKTSSDDLTSNRKARLDSVEDLYRSKGSHSERSGPNEDLSTGDKYAEVIKHLKRFFDEFKGFAMNHEIKDKIVEVVKNYREEDPLQILKCMNYIVQLLAKTPKKEDYDSKQSEEHQRLSYEELLQKAENDIRQHIRIEQQLKLLIDNMQAKLDEYELNEGTSSPQNKKETASVKEVRAEVARLTEINQQKDKEISSLQKLLKKKDDTIKAFDEQLSNIPLLEHKLRSLGERYRAEKENICSYYEQEYANLTKEVQHIHRVLNINIETEEKVKLLQEELLSYKDFNVKKAHILENKIKQLNNTGNSYDKDGESRGKEDTDYLMNTETGFEDRRYSARPSTTSTSVLKSRGGYDLQTHRCSTEMSRNSENRNSSKSIPTKKKRDFINEMKSTPVLAARTMSRLNMRGDNSQQQQQPQQGAPKTQREVESYFNYLKRRLDNLQNVNEKERETLRSADGRRSSSAKRGAYLTTSSTSMRKDKSYEKLSKVDITKVQEEKSDYISSERAHHTKSVPKLRPSASIAHVKALKH